MYMHPNGITHGRGVVPWRMPAHSSSTGRRQEPSPGSDGSATYLRRPLPRGSVFGSVFSRGTCASLRRPPFSSHMAQTSGRPGVPSDGCTAVLGRTDADIVVARICVYARANENILRFTMVALRVSSRAPSSGSVGCRSWVQLLSDRDTKIWHAICKINSDAVRILTLFVSALSRR